jgi:hypothetical protein
VEGPGGDLLAPELRWGNRRINETVLSHGSPPGLLGDRGSRPAHAGPRGPLHDACHANPRFPSPFPTHAYVAFCRERRFLVQHVAGSAAIRTRNLRLRSGASFLRDIWNRVLGRHPSGTKARSTSCSVLPRRDNTSPAPMHSWSSVFSYGKVPPCHGLDLARESSRGCSVRSGRLTKRLNEPGHRGWAPFRRSAHPVNPATNQAKGAQSLPATCWPVEPDRAEARSSGSTEARWGAARTALVT